MSWSVSVVNVLPKESRSHRKQVRKMRTQAPKQLRRIQSHEIDDEILCTINDKDKKKRILDDDCMPASRP